MSERHGIYISEVLTGLTAPVTVDSAVPVAFVTAPVHLAEDPYGSVNIPRLCYTYAEAVKYFGFSLRSEIWNAYTAPQVIYSHFVLYGVAPLILINVLDPEIHKESIGGQALKIEDGEAVLKADGVLLDTVVVKRGSIVCAEGTDYTLSFSSDGLAVVSSAVMEGMEDLTVSYDRLTPEAVDMYDIIGGYNSVTGRNTGLELVNEIYPRFTVVPGQIIAPGFSGIPAVAAVMETKAGNVSGQFRCISLHDIPTVDSETGAKILYTDVSAWVQKNGLISSRQINCWPKVTMDGQEYWFSTQLAGLIASVDWQNGGTPYASPSNQVMKISGICYDGGEEAVLGMEQANYLNGQGIVTAINYTRGWTAWGNRTGIYPGDTDVKDSFIPVRRMFDWIGNTIVQTWWSRIDLPMTRRHINTIVDSVNMWFNTLQTQGYILGGRIEFLSSDNTLTDLISGTVTFQVSITPPVPMQEIHFRLEYDPDYLSALFS